MQKTHYVLSVFFRMDSLVDSDTTKIHCKKTYGI